MPRESLLLNRGVHESISQVANLAGI
ncbi:hypothetical protein BDI4_970043 [Burkholderia diffusa]|nr:hypothetical protein BDI4_970043 [Burkholderia diffusa]